MIVPINILSFLIIIVSCDYCIVIITDKQIKITSEWIKLRCEVGQIGYKNDWGLRLINGMRFTCHKNGLKMCALWNAGSPQLNHSVFAHLEQIFGMRG